MQQVVPMLCISLIILLYSACVGSAPTVALCSKAEIHRDMGSCPCRPALPAGVSCTQSCLTPGGDCFG